jgi:hypothetical protein
MESKSFETVKELNKEYEIVRDDILVRHGFEKGAKVRLKNAIMMYQKFNGEWVRTTSVKTNMIDRVKMYDGLNAEFMLKAMV